MGKRGQVAGFILVAIVILLLALALQYSFKNRAVAQEQQNELVGDSRQLNLALSDCLRDMTEDYIVLMGLNGGTIAFVQDPYSVIVPVRAWLVNGTARIPEPAELEHTLQDVIETATPFCAQELNMTITGAVQATVKFQENTIIVVLQYPVKATREQTEYSFSDFDFRIPVRMLHVLQLAAETTLINQALQTQAAPDLLVGKDVDVQIDVHEKKWIYQFIDHKSLVKQKPFQFFFVEQFS